MFPDLFWALLFVQLALGAFDILYHHEFLEGLAWRPSQKNELRLHGARNLFYAVVFFGLAVLKPTGAVAIVALVILAAELVITLIDFVEEDRTRRLPATERIAHTLLALNYGAILVLLVPVLIDWAAEPTGVALVARGVWSLLLLIAVLGVIVFGVRDFASVYRLSRLKTREAATLVQNLGEPKSVLVAGGTGFIGRSLVEALARCGHRVTVLTRSLRHAEKLAAPVRIVTDLGQIADDEVFDAIVNLAGEPVASLWTPRRRREIIRSRVAMNEQLVALAARLWTKPDVYIAASAIGAYGADVEGPVDEASEIVDDGSFSYASCAHTEAAARRMETVGIRTALLRIGLVLDPAGGSLGRMLFAFEFGLGGAFGDGRQWMSWITRDDLVRLIAHIIRDRELSGPVNAVAPNPVRNADFARALGRALNRPTAMPAPAFLLRTALGGFGEEILLGGQNVQPAKALASGFRFRDQEIGEALARLTGRPLTASAAGSRNRAAASAVSGRTPRAGRRAP